MADHSWHVEVTECLVYTLSLPTNWVEVQKVISAVRQHLVGVGVGESDDVVTVEGTGDELRFVAVLGTERKPL